jgi:hypothetical protein
MFEMARPKKPVNYEEEIQKLDMQITKWKNTIKELEEEKERLLNEKREKEVGVLYEAVRSSGKSVDDIIALIQE